MLLVALTIRQQVWQCARRVDKSNWSNKHHRIIAKANYEEANFNIMIQVARDIFTVHPRWSWIWQVHRFTCSVTVFLPYHKCLRFSSLIFFAEVFPFSGRCLKVFPFTAEDELLQMIIIVVNWIRITSLKLYPSTKILCWINHAWIVLILVIDNLVYHLSVSINKYDL